ncbi:MAG: ScpA family protein [Pirellulales bacterium]
MDFRVDLDIFRGPLDLLLYLVRKHEVEIVEIPVARVTDQFLSHLSVLEELDVNAAGEFLEVASRLIEMKSRMVLPRADEVEEELDLTQQELVRRLLEYKKFRDAASILDERSRNWQERFPRLENDLPTRRVDPADQPIHEVELWDLVSAFGRILKERKRDVPTNIVYDDTPIHVFMDRIEQRISSEKRMLFSRLFIADQHKSTQVGIFLAMLELVRHHHIHAEQNSVFGEIWLFPGPNFSSPLDALSADNYDHQAPDSGTIEQ